MFLLFRKYNENLGFYRGEVFSMVCLLPLTACFKLQLGERNAFFFVNHNLITLRMGQSHLRREYILQASETS